MNKQPYEHLISNIPNTPLNREIINELKKMMIKSNSKWRIQLRGRGVNEQGQQELDRRTEANKHRGWLRPMKRWDGFPLKYSEKFSVYIRPRRIKHNKTKYGHYK